jgi:hypothetical protein
MISLNKILAALFGVETKYEQDVMRLARAEYGRDWQYAYFELMAGNTPNRGFKL